MKLLLKTTLLLAILLPATAMAYNFQVNGIYYNIISNYAVEVTSGDNPYKGDVSIPPMVTIDGTYYSVTTIDNWAFEYCTGLTSVVIPNSVTTIGYWAFAGCTGLTNVVIPNSVTNIYNGLFYGCTGLTSMVIPNSITAICAEAFYGCTGLMSVTIGNSVSTIGEWAFDGCTSLASIRVASGNTTYDSRENCNAIIETASNTLIMGCKSTTIPNSVTTIGRRAFYGCTGLTSVVIPNSVTSIGDYVFYGCTGLSSIIVESGNSTYDSRDNCNAIIETANNTLIMGFKNTTIPNSVTTIGRSAFEGCTSLTSVVIPNSVTSLGRGAFRETGLTSVLIPGSVQTIGNKAFMSCENLTDVTLSEGLTLIDEEAFCETGITEIHLPESLVRIGEQAFEDTHLTSITIPKNVAYLGNEGENELYGGVFDHCYQMLEVNVDPENASYASYDGMLLTKDKKTFLYYPAGRTGQCVIPNSVTTIGGDWGGFTRCAGLTSVIIPRSVEYICDDVFYGCDALTLVRIFAVTPPSVGRYAFSNSRFSNTTLEVPSESVEVYRAHEYWGQFQNIQAIVQIPGDVNGDSVTDVGDVTTLINAVLNGIQVLGGDINGDSIIDVGDVTALISMVLNGN